MAFDLEELWDFASKMTVVCVNAAVDANSGRLNAVSLNSSVSFHILCQLVFFRCLGTLYFPATAKIPAYNYQ